MIINATHPIIACPLCMSGADDNTAIAANSAIGVLFVILLVVLAGFLSFIGYIAKRSKMGIDPVPVPVKTSKNHDEKL